MSKDRLRGCGLARGLWFVPRGHPSYVQMSSLESQELVLFVGGGDVKGGSGRWAPMAHLKVPWAWGSDVSPSHMGRGGDI